MPADGLSEKDTSSWLEKKVSGLGFRVVLCASLHLVSLPSHRVCGAEDRRLEKNLQEGLPGSWGGSEPDFDEVEEDEDEQFAKFWLRAKW